MDFYEFEYFRIKQIRSPILIFTTDVTKAYICEM